MSKTIKIDKTIEFNPGSDFHQCFGVSYLERAKIMHPFVNDLAKNLVKEIGEKEPDISMLPIAKSLAANIFVKYFIENKIPLEFIFSYALDGMMDEITRFLNFAEKMGLTNKL